MIGRQQSKITVVIEPALLTFEIGIADDRLTDRFVANQEIQSLRFKVE